MNNLLSMVKFPDNFLWGASTSAYQVEGNNKNSDWWEWEKRIGLKETSGAACRHYELFREDFDLAKGLNHNAHRFSIEWGRIEPEEGRFSSEEIAHYREVVLALRERGMEPIVTLHHFTNPLWFVRLGGWQNKNCHKYFLRYAERIAGALCDKVRWWVTINEPLVYAYYGYVLGIWPPQEKSLLKAKRITDNLALTHIKAYGLIHNIYKQRNLPPPMVSIAKHVRAFEPCDASLKNRFAAYLRDRLFNFSFLNGLIRKGSLDYIGITYYTRDVVGTATKPLCHPEGTHSLRSVQAPCPKDLKILRPFGAQNDTMQIAPTPRQIKKNSLGWEIYPEGLLHLLRRLNKYRLPIFILENGICTTDDDQRWDFILSHLKNVRLAIQHGVNIVGYLYWSLMDNYEWDKGFEPRFGLIGIDYTTYRRTVRESAKKFAIICKR